MFLRGIGGRVVIVLLVFEMLSTSIPRNVFFIVWVGMVRWGLGFGVCGRLPWRGGTRGPYSP